MLLIILLGLVQFAGNSAAQSLSIREITGAAAKYRDRQVQVEGRVERWVDAAGAPKAGVYVLKDNYGDELRVRVSGLKPAVGEKVTIQGVLVFDSANNDYYLQSSSRDGGVKAAEEANKESGLRSYLDLLPVAAIIGAPSHLRVLAAALSLIFLFIAVIAIKMRMSHKKVLAVPDFSFDETETIKIDVNGRFFGSEEEDDCTVVLLPAQFKVTRGPTALTGRVFRPTSALTKVGREEASVNKSIGWIAIPSSCTTVSRYQADLIYHSGDYYVENRSRSTETKVNGLVLSAGDPYKLSDQDVIAFGDVELTYSSYNC